MNTIFTFMRCLPPIALLLLAVSAVRCSPSDSSRAPTGIRSSARVAYPVTAASPWLVDAKLMASSNDLDSPFAEPSIAIDGDLMAVSVPFDRVKTNGQGLGMGAVYILQWNGTSWMQQARLLPPEEDFPDCMNNPPTEPGMDCPLFGASLALSGSTVLVGAPYADIPGHAYVFVRKGTFWIKEATLNGRSAFHFGHSVSLSGNTAVVAMEYYTQLTVFENEASRWPETQTIEGGPIAAIDHETLAVDGNGQVHIYVRRRKSWTLEQRLEKPSAATRWTEIRLSGDALLVETSTSSESGSVSAFVRGTSGWAGETLVPSVRRVEGLRRSTMSLSGDTALIATGAGARVFVRNGSTWNEQPSLATDSEASSIPAVSISGRHAALLHNQTIYAFEYVRGTWQRVQKTHLVWPTARVNSVATSGDKAVIAWTESDGSAITLGATLFAKTGSAWTEEQPLTLLDDAPLTHNAGASVALSGDQLVLSPTSVVNGIGARAFSRVQGSWKEPQALIAADGTPVAGPVSLSGTTAIIGTPDRGRAVVFVRGSSSWNEQAELTVDEAGASARFGVSVSVSGDLAVVGAPKALQNSGAAYLFARNGDKWTQRQRLEPRTPEVGSGFGFSVSVKGDLALVGAPLTRQGLGVAHLFARGASSWDSEKVLTGDESTGVALFGSAVSVSGDTAIIGAPGLTPSAYIFAKVADQWLQEQKLTPLDDFDHQIGTSVSAGDETALIGAEQSAYVLRRGPLRNVGAACSRGHECMSGVCIHGVCCEQACDKPCESCAGYLTGQKDGTCALVQIGTRCAPDPTTCLSASTYAATPTCDANGVCQTNGVQCAAGAACVGDDIVGTCAPDCGILGRLDHQLCSPKHWCSRATGDASKATCEPRHPGGSSCTAAEQCASNQCVSYQCTGAQGDPCASDADCSLPLGLKCADGYCCNSQCTAICEACNLDGHEGDCRAVDGDPADGHGYCPGAGTECGAKCRGSRDSCLFPKLGEPCGAGTTCDNVTATQSGHMCTAAGECKPQTGVPCTPYSVCANANECLRRCASSKDCVATHYCDHARAECTPKLADGAACANASECRSEHCVDGVCCDQDCDGACEACRFSETDPKAGQCRAIEGTPPPHRKPCDGEAPCAGTCKAPDRDKCTYPGVATECGKRSCRGNVETLPRGCDGAGRCAPEETKSCGTYTCDEPASTCKIRCATNADCASGAICNPDKGECAVSGARCRGKFVVVNPDGSVQSCKGACNNGVCTSTCAKNADCASGFVCTSGQCADAGGSNSGSGDGGGDDNSGCGCRFVGARLPSNASRSALFGAWAFALLLARRRLAGGRRAQRGRREFL
jgi:hypothetical protein